MEGRIVVADTGPIFSLAILDKIHFLDHFFENIHIPEAVMNEVLKYKKESWFEIAENFCLKKVKKISSENFLSSILDYGESEALILATELDADLLLIDDKKARAFAENNGIKCTGTLGFLILLKKQKIVGELKPLLETLLNENRYYGLSLLNTILIQNNETPIELDK